MLFRSLVTCRKGHSPFDNYSLTSLTLYLLPWVSNIRNEFRVFVYKGEIKAISQQNIYRVLYSDKEKDYLSKLCYIVIDSFYFDIKNKIDWIKDDTYVYDVYVMCNKAYFIEVNPFGKQYSSGSGLFHWLKDDCILTTSNNKCVVVRYTSSDQKSES